MLVSACQLKEPNRAFRKKSSLRKLLILKDSNAQKCALHQVN
jgi:hypothetical protein